MQVSMFVELSVQISNGNLIDKQKNKYQEIDVTITYTTAYYRLLFIM